MSEQDTVTIEGNIRTGFGKGYSRKLRAKGLIPGNILDNAKSTSIELNPKWLSKAYLGGKEFDLVLDGKTSRVRIHELQLNPVKRSALHVDLMYVK